MLRCDEIIFIAELLFIVKFIGTRLYNSLNFISGRFTLKTNN